MTIKMTSVKKKKIFKGLSEVFEKPEIKDKK